MEMVVNRRHWQDVQPAAGAKDILKVIIQICIFSRCSESVPIYMYCVGCLVAYQHQQCCYQR
jgi:hypothetical protein